MEQPGPVYDRVMRRLVEADLGAAFRMLGIAVTDAPAVLPATFPATTLNVDLLARDGARRLVHVEYVRTVEPDLTQRMLQYRAAVMGRYPEHRLDQHVVVLGPGRVRGYDDLAQHGFALDLKVTYLRDLDPGVFLSTPALAPLAVLGRGDTLDRGRALARALVCIRDQGGARAAELLECATVLATIRLAATTIESIVEEVGMTVESIAEFYRQTRFGQALVHEGREQGREQGLEQIMEALLTERFGTQPGLPEAARRLAAWPDYHLAVRAVLAADNLADLPDQPPT